MFSRKKPEGPKRRNHDLAQFGLTDIPDDFDPSMGFGGDHDDQIDSDLEAELAAISGGGGGSKLKPKPKPKASLVPPSELERMIAESLKNDISEDEGDELEIDDAELLGELQDISSGFTNANNANVTESEPTAEIENVSSPQAPEVMLPTTTISYVGVIKKRIEMYKQAEASARATGESSKVRRFGRGLKTLNDLLKQVNAGKQITDDDIPPEVYVKSDGNEFITDKSKAVNMEGDTPAVTTEVEPSAPTEKNNLKTVGDTVPPENSVSDPLIRNMKVRQQEYKAAALEYKKKGDTVTALQFLKVVKQFDVVIKMVEDGKEVDLSDMPPPPDEFKQFLENMQASAEQSPQVVPPSVDQSLTEQSSADACNSILESLQKRMEKYKSVEETAKSEENTGKARRFGRIVKQYENAIKAYKAGRTVNYEELPIPPGFGPLPTENVPTSAPTPTPAPALSSSESEKTIPGSNKSDSSTKDASPKSKAKSPIPQNCDLTTRTSGNQQKNNLAEQQMKILLDRQREFKLAALEAKKAGEINQAKEYLKIYKGFDSLLNAASSGLPVDLNTLPVPPSQRENLEASFAIVTQDECDPDDDISDIGVRIEEQLAKQLMMCKNTRDHHKAMGDIAGMNRFENLALTVQKDLDLVRYSKRKNFPLPKFHYEKRSFNIVHCNTDLTDNELEVVAVRGINYNVPNPKDVDTYVKVEFPLLNDETFKDKTSLVKDTDSPEYNQHFKIDIIRGNRQFQRIFKRHAVKFEVYSRGGFLRSDILIGTVNVKLQPLETKCDIHDTFDLMEGRKVIGGKLEIKVRVRNPILTKQIEHLNEKWLVLDA